MINFKCGFSTKVTCAFILQEDVSELSELNTFKPRKITIVLKILIR